MAVIVRSASNVLLLTHAAMIRNATTVMMYGTIEKADAYFGNLLEGQRWMFTPVDKKRMALISATRRIDRLNFRGVKTDPSQPLQFPRGTDTLVPVEIQWACFELAQELLKGTDPNTERDNTQVTVQAYGSLRTEFDPGTVLPYMVAGIPSATAWGLLEPYLSERRSVDLERIS